MTDKEQKENQYRDRALADAQEAVEKSDEDILKEIFYYSSIPPSHGPQTSLNRSLAYFSSLLLKLSKQAEESTKETTNLNKRLLYLTRVIVILTAILLLVTFFEFPKVSILGNQTYQTHPDTQQNKTNNIKNENRK
jgi:hypothetical protein